MLGLHKHEMHPPAGTFAWWNAGASARTARTRPAQPL